MPDVKQTQPVQSDTESSGLHEKDRYKDVKNLKDNATREVEQADNAGGSSESKPSVKRTNVKVEKPSVNTEGSNNDNRKMAKRTRDAGSEGAKEGVSNAFSGESMKAQAKFMLQQQAAQAVSNVAKSNVLVQIANKVVTSAANAWGNVVGFGQAALGAIKTVGSWITGAASSFVHGVAGFASWAVSTVSGALGISTTAAAVTTSTVSVSTLAAATLIAVSIATNADIAQRDVYINQCGEEVKAAQTEMAEGDYDAIKLEYAQKIYSVLKVYGLAEENIAGVLGNWEAESGIDPTGVETIFSEKYTIGPRKQAAEDCGFDIAQIDYDYHIRFPLIKLAGLGLGGFTDTNDGAVNNTRLREFARANGKNWYDLDLQLAFCLCSRENGGHGVLFSHWDPEPNPRDAAYTFARDWEGNTTLAQEERKSFAEQWFAKFSSWSIDTAYANSVLDMARTAALSAGESSLRNKFKDCNQATWADNSSIAKAAVSYAYATEEEGKGNNGTALYQAVHRAVFPGDEWFQSCDRSVATAVRWAGADDNFKAGGCSSILTHMITSERWQEIDWGADSSKLLPGDVLIVSNDVEGHVILYVGNEIIKQKYPSAPDNFEIVSGSIGDPPNPAGSAGSRSPGCGVLWSCYNHYRAFRNVKPETDSRYKSVGIASGVTAGASIVQAERGGS